MNGSSSGAAMFESFEDNSFRFQAYESLQYGFQASPGDQVDSLVNSVSV